MECQWLQQHGILQVRKIEDNFYFIFEMTYYGIIIDICKLDYEIFTEIVFL